jgi:hypothetical protein
MIVPSSAAASPPANDAPASAGEFTSYTAENGTPSALQAIAELAEAGPDRGVPRCLGPRSFARTVWYRVPAADTPRELSVEASGQTLDVLDLAAFVQDAGASPAAQAPAQPNACAGAGAGAADAAEEPTAGVGLRVPAGHAVLIQVGRRGPRATPDEERAVLSLAQTTLSDRPSPAGDVATLATTRVRAGRDLRVPLAGATLTGEDPAAAACPSLGSVWRRFVPRRSGSYVVSATGSAVGALTVFGGTLPADALGCVNREGRGPLSLPVRAPAATPLWIRLGSDRPADSAAATLSIRGPR